MLLNPFERALRNEGFFQFEVKSVVVKSSLKVVGIDINKQSKDLTENVSPKDCLKDEGKDCVDAFYWIFGSDVSVSDGSDYCDAVVHYVGVHLIPGEKGHLIEGPAIVDPDNVWGVGTIVVCVVDVETHQIKEDPHEMCVIK
jgi:hypothetical protein